VFAKHAVKRTKSSLATAVRLLAPALVVKYVDCVVDSMEDRIRLIVAIGAAFSAYFQPCLETVVSDAQRSGVGKEEIAEPIEIARSIKKGSIAVRNRFVCARAIGHTGAISDVSEGCCG
jgi:alkylhydroperoxidase/carboxymuconolactone decarboxylase family protein YurZ